MKPILIGVILITAIYCQVSPIWSESPRVQTRDVILIPNHISVSQTWQWNTTYNTTWLSNPYVALSIVDLRIATNAQTINFMSYISFTNSMTYFTHKIQVVSPTEIWFFRCRYIAYEGSFSQLSDITMTYMRYKETQTGAKKLNSINTGAGTVRSQSRDTTLNVVQGNNYTVSIFVTGFIGTINSNHFQVNSTQIIQNNVDVFVLFDVAADTVVKQIAVYVLVADLTALYTRCWTFVETATTKARNGTQYTFFVYSEVSYSDNYMYGLRSFSIVNNIQYNFTTYNTFNFTTFSNSYYNDVSHFNLWIRFCPSPYIFFNKVDFLCYNACPNGTYLITNDSLCVACLYTCYTCSNNATCDICAVNRVKDATTGNCVCIDYYYEYNLVCVPCHYTCKTCQFPAQFYNCLSCDTSMNRALQPYGTGTDKICKCSAGFADVGTTACSQVCGDGIISYLPCDDGNLFNDDGCSSTCGVQPYFNCVNTPAPSKCYFIGNLTIQVTRIQKDPIANRASFYIKLNPYAPLLDKLTLENVVTNVTLIKQVSIVPSGGELIYTIEYPSDMQGTPITIGLKPSADPTNQLSQFYPINITINASATNGLMLNYHSTFDYTQSIKLGFDSLIIGFVFMAFAFFLCYDDWKELGLELFFMLQLSYMSFVVLPKMHPYNQNGCKIGNVMGWNGIIPQSLPPYHFVPVLQQMGYSVAFENNFNIMVILPALCLVLYGVYRLVLYFHEKDKLDGQTSLQFDQTLKGKILLHFRFDLFVYWMLFNMQQILMGTIIQSTKVINGGIYAYIVLLLAGIIVCIVGLFLKPQSLGAYRKKLFHRSYGDKTFLVVLVSTLLMDLFLLLSVLVQRYIFYGMFVFPVIVIVYTIARRPFKTMGNNVRLVIIQACLLVVFALQVSTMFTDFLTHRYYIIGIIVCMGIAVLVTLIMWIYDIVKRICRFRGKQGYQDQSDKNQSVKQEESINQKVRQAGHALMNGPIGGNSSRVPSYQMTRFNNRPRAPVQTLRRPMQSPNRKTALRQANQQRGRDNSKIRSKYGKNDSYDTSGNKERQREKQKQRQRQRERQREKERERERERERQRQRQNRDVTIPGREDTIEKMGSTARRRTNIYQQILEQTSNNKR